MSKIDNIKSLKAATTERQVVDIIRKRWSPRAFSDEQIAEETMLTLFEAAAWTASSYNEQPWRYIYAHREDEEGFQRLLSCINPGNQTWAKDASVLILSIGNTTFARNDKPNRHYMHDVGAANTTLLLQAVSLDIYGHMMAGFDYNKTVETFDLNAPLEPVCFMALGFPSDNISHLEAWQQKSEKAVRTRRSVETFVKKL